MPGTRHPPAGNAPAPAAATGNAELFLLAVNLTRRCNLACSHCYLDANTLKNGGPDELSTDEAKDLLTQVAQRGTDTMVVLTGGEPLLRPDLDELVAHGTALGLSVVIGSNGVLLDRARVRELKTAGAMGVGISLDSLDPARHDAFRGRPGAWQQTLSAMDACRTEGLPFQVHFSVTEGNADEVPGMIDFARAIGARVLNVFFLICTGRGESMSDISPTTYENVLHQLVTAQVQSSDLLIRARCAPHFKRVAYQLDPASPLTRAQGYEGGGCLAGIHYCRVTPEGEVTPCPYMPEADGSIREQPFWDIWDSGPTLRTLRQPTLNGSCGECEYSKLCGGCRARPLALGGGLMDADPWCDYRPQGGAVIEPLAEHAPALPWTAAAEARMERVPSFLRKMVKKRAEVYAVEQGAAEVTETHLKTLGQKRFGDAGPPAADGSGTAVPTGLPWTAEAAGRLQQMPAFLQEGVRQVAEDLARGEGRLEVNVKLLDRLEAEDDPGRTLPWTQGAEDFLADLLCEKKPEVRMFVAPALEAEAERLAKRRKEKEVAVRDVAEAACALTGGVEWAPEATRRLADAPDFVRAGIKKAAEFNARREGLACITSADLTRFRNRAMLRAVQRMKAFGMTDLSFDAYDIARERVPRLVDNPEADKRFGEIRRFVEARDNPGELLGQELLDSMKSKLRENKKNGKTSPASAVRGPS